MEKKKNPKADLESKRKTFFLIGLVVALGFVFTAFEWKTQPRKVILEGGTPVFKVEEEFIPIVREPKAEQPQLPKPKVIEFFEIVENNEIADDPEFEATEPIDFVPVDLPKVFTTPAEEPEETIFVNNVEVPAEFPGGERALYKYISDQVKYPVIAQENGVEGKVYINFVVDETGKAVDIKVARPGDASLDAEALRVINSLPRFKPAIQGGKKVKVYYTAVINFKLQ